VETLFDVIVVERDPLPVKSPGGIILLPDWDKNEEVGIYTGTVKVAGPKCHTLKVGDHIIYHRSNYAPMEYEGEEFSVFHESEVLALIED
jgi:co-chaperonin GroES (HSP10)